jgi:hypothetical protein
MLALYAWMDSINDSDAVLCSFEHLVPIMPWFFLSRAAFPAENNGLARSWGGYSGPPWTLPLSPLSDLTETPELQQDPFSMDWRSAEFHTSRKRNFEMARKGESTRPQPWLQGLVALASPFADAE